MGLPLIIPPAINIQDLDYWADVMATPLHLMEPDRNCWTVFGGLNTI